MKQNKIFGFLLVLTLALGMILALGGCNNNSNENQTPNDNQQKQQQTDDETGKPPQDNSPDNPAAVDPKTVDGVPEMHDVKWDMTQEQLTSLAGKGEIKEDGNIYSKKSIFGYDADVVSIMQDDKLVRVEYTITLNNSDEAADAASSINRLISRKYGEADLISEKDPK